MRPNLKNYFAFSGWILPLGLFVGGFILLPVLGTLWTSLHQDVTFLPYHWIGLRHYGELLQDPGIFEAMKFTLLFTLVAVPLELILGLLFALLLNEKTPWQGWLRLAVLIPWMIPTAVAARTWELVYHFNYGILNQVLLKIGLIDAPMNWLGTEMGAFGALVLADVWKTSSFVALLLLAGLQTIPQDLYEQAQMDRANLFQRFFYITLPLLKPSLVVALLFRTIDTLRIFDLIYILTHGGPGGATTSLSFYSYKYLLSGDFGFGSAISAILFLLSLMLSMIYLRAGKFSEVLRE